MPYCDDKKIIFLHIPKTGGTMVKNILKIRFLSSSDPSIRPSPQHLTCELLKDRLGQKKYDQYYKFTFIRNPWARLLSSYFWRQTLPKKRKVLHFFEYIKLVEHTVLNKNYYKLEFGDHYIPQIKYTDENVDVFKYENLSGGIVEVASKLNIPKPIVGNKKVKPYDQYWEYYNKQTQSIVENIYSEEIEKFNFQFGE